MTDDPDNDNLLSDEIERYIRDRTKLEVDAAVQTAVSEEEERRFRQIKWLIALVGLVGLGTFGTLSNYLIEKAVDSRLEARTGNISDTMDLIRFDSVALKLELGDSFSPEDRTAVMTYLRKAAQNERVRHTPEFNSALVQVTKAFGAAGQSASIDEIFQLYEREILSSDSLVEILLNHYGQEISSRPIAPADDFALHAFERLEAVAGGARVPELALVYRTLYLHRQQPDKVQPGVVVLITRAKDLKDSDLRRFFHQILLRTRSDNWLRENNSEEAGPEGAAFEKLTRSFVKTYSGTISKMTGIEQENIMAYADNGLDAYAAKKTAIRLAAAAKQE